MSGRGHRAHRCSLSIFASSALLLMVNVQANLQAASNGHTFMSVTPDCYGGNLHELHVPSLADCQQKCVSYKGCKFISFSNHPTRSGSTCYLKSGLGNHTHHPCIGCDADGFCGNTGACDPSSAWCSSNYRVLTCTTSSGAACKVCKALSDRTAQDQCAECNSGYWLKRAACTAFTCTTRLGAGCKICKGQTERTANDHCAVCNTGYELDGAACKVITSTTAVTTTAVTTGAAQLVHGSMNLYVPNAAQFVQEEGVESAFQIAISEIYEINETWVHHVSARLSSSRRLGALRQNLISLPRFLAQVTDVDVSWTIYIPFDDPTNMIVTVFVDKFIAKAISEVTKEVSEVLSRYKSLSPYAVNVTWKYNSAAASNAGLGAQRATNNNGDFVWLFWVCATASALMVSLLAGMTFYLWSWRSEAKKIAFSGPSLASTSASSHVDCNTREVSSEAVAKLADCEFSQFLHPPDAIDENEGERMRKLAQAMKLCALSDCKVGLIYAAGARPSDAHGYGPGTFFAVAVLKYLYDNNIHCHCDLMLPDGVPVEVRRGGLVFDRFSACRAVIVLQTKALYHDPHTLIEIYRACKSNLRLLPLRFEEELVKPGTEWPHVERTALQEVIMVDEVLRRFCTLNSTPSPPYTIVNQPTVLGEMVADLRSSLGQGETESLPKRNSVRVECLAFQGVSASRPNKVLVPAHILGRSPAKVPPESGFLASNVQCAVKWHGEDVGAVLAPSVLEETCLIGTQMEEDEKRRSRSDPQFRDVKPGQTHVRGTSKRTNGSDATLDCTKKQSRDLRSKKHKADSKRARTPQDKSAAADTQLEHVASAAERRMDSSKRTELGVPSSVSKTTKDSIYVSSSERPSSPSKAAPQSRMNSSMKNSRPPSDSPPAVKEKCKPECAVVASNQVSTVVSSTAVTIGSGSQAEGRRHEAKRLGECRLKPNTSRDTSTHVPPKKCGSCSPSKKRGHLTCRGNETKLEE